MLERLKSRGRISATDEIEVVRHGSEKIVQKSVLTVHGETNHGTLGETGKFQSNHVN